MLKVKVDDSRIVAVRQQNYCAAHILTSFIAEFGLVKFYSEINPGAHKCTSVQFSCLAYKDYVIPTKMATPFDGWYLQSRKLAYSLLSTKYCQTFEEILVGMTVFAMEGMVVSS